MLVVNTYSIANTSIINVLQSFCPNNYVDDKTKYVSKNR